MGTNLIDILNGESFFYLISGPCHSSLFLISSGTKENREEILFN